MAILVLHNWSLAILLSIKIHLKKILELNLLHQIVLHHQQGSGVQQVFHGDRTGDAQLVYNVRPVEPRGGDTEAILSKLNIRPNVML